MFSKFKSSAKLLANTKKLPQANKFEANPMQRISYSHESYEAMGKPLILEDDPAGTKPSNLELFKSKIANLKQSTTNFIKMFVKGSKSAFHDARYLSSVTFMKPKQDRTLEEISKISRIKIDLKKFVPFYTSLVIPGGAAVMFIYLYLCPRGVPTYFMKPQDQMIKQQKLMENQARAHGLLREHLLSVMRKEGYQGADDDTHHILQFLNFYTKTLLQKLKLSKLSMDMLKSANDFVLVEYLEGTYIINKVIQDTINLSSYCFTSIRRLTGGGRDKSLWDYCKYDRSFSFETFPMSIMKKMLLRKQFKKKLNTLKNEDNALLMGYYGDLKDQTAIMIAKDRGFHTDDGNEARKWLVQNWKMVIQDNDQNQVLSFWESVVLYKPPYQETLDS